MTAFLLPGGMAAKTTLYLNDDAYRALKTWAARTGRKSMTACVREAIQEYLDRRRNLADGARLARRLRGSVPKGAFGDPLDFQRRARAEWGGD